MKIPKITISKKPTYIKLAEDIDFYELFKKIENEYSNCFLFESLGTYSYLSRHSIIGFNPEYIISARGQELKINDALVNVSNPYYALRDIMPEPTISREFAGGLVGYLAFDAINYFEPSLQCKAHEYFDTFRFGVYTDGIVLDKYTNEVFYFYYNENRFKEIESLIHRSSVTHICNVEFQRDTLTKEHHAQVVERVKEHIRAGDTFQCQVGFKKEYRITGNALILYERLRTSNPSPHMYYFKSDKQKIIGASPELLFRLRGREMETYPLAGTIRRGKNEHEDTILARKLLHDPKEIAEHNMLVDLHRNDLGRVAEFGTVSVKSLMDIKKFSHVQHISSEISATISDTEDVFSALASNFPAGTLSGAPKVESIKIINENEPDARGPYGGAIGSIGFNRNCTFAIPIRTLFIHDTAAFVQASGGVVYDSIAENEYDEVQRKLAALKEVLQS